MGNDTAFFLGKMGVWQGRVSVGVEVFDNLNLPAHPWPCLLGFPVLRFGFDSAYQWVLPQGWKERVLPVGEYGLLTVSHISRSDFIAMKVFASRDSDRKHLMNMDVTEQELCSAENHLDRLVDKGASADRIEQARTTLKILRAES